MSRWIGPGELSSILLRHSLLETYLKAHKLEIALLINPKAEATAKGTF